MNGVFHRVNMHCVGGSSCFSHIPLRCGSIMLRMRKLFSSNVLSIVIVIAYKSSYVLILHIAR